MTIQYLKKLAANPVIWDQDEDDEMELVGCSVDEIETLENHILRKFPQAYREYLYLAGKDNCFFGNAIDYNYEELESIQKGVKDCLEEEGISLKRDFWVIDSYLYDQFHFFYFDEGENPQVYHFSIYTYEEKGYESSVLLVSTSLSSFIERNIPTKFFRATAKVLQIFIRVYYRIKYRNRCFNYYLLTYINFYIIIL